MTDELNATSTNAAQACEKMKVGSGTRVYKWYIACGVARAHQQLRQKMVLLKQVGQFLFRTSTVLHVI